MTKLFKNGMVVNVFTDTVDAADVLVDDDKIVGVGQYDQADEIIDVSGKYLCPGFIDGHIHIESTMLTPWGFANACIPHGTCAVVADPHEIANVCGTVGIRYMLESIETLPMRIYLTLPSCVPATPFDENGATLTAADLEPLYNYRRVLGLAEMMNYPGVLCDDPDVLGKLHQARKHKKVINGHAPLLSGKGLDRYIAEGVQDDHECTNIAEAREKLSKGQWIMIREGTSARNLASLIDLFDEPLNRRCLLVADDKHPYDILENGHLDANIRKAVRMGKSPLVGIRMATIQSATCFDLKHMGAVAPGYFANILVLNDLNTVDIDEVYCSGKLVCHHKQIIPFDKPVIAPAISRPVLGSFNISTLTADDFMIKPKTKKCRVIHAIPGQILTDEVIREPDFEHGNGIDIRQDIIKLAVCERHKHTGHIGIGFIEGLGIRRGAIASSVSHDSHNLIVAGADEADMALAGNTVAQMNGGLCVVENGKVLATLPLPVAGLMSEKSAEEVARENQDLRDAVLRIGVSDGIEPFMNLAFVSLPVIPHLKMTTLGLVDVDRFSPVPLFV